MRKIIVAMVCLTGLCGCVTGQDAQRQAGVNCQMVGIAPMDPAYALCVRAYLQQDREDALVQNYRYLNSAAPEGKRTIGMESTSTTNY